MNNDEVKEFEAMAAGVARGTARVLVTGKTYPHRAQLRAMGGEWSAAEQGWWIPTDQAPAARELVRGGRRRRSSGPEIIYTTFSSGAVVYRNARGTCEDAPCCGCCGSVEGGRY
jgi:hypothetical protein